MLASFLSGEFLLHIPFWFYFYAGSFSYTSRAGFIFSWGVFLTHPVLTLTFPCWIHFCLGSFSYTSRAGFIFSWGVFLTHPVLTLTFPCWIHFCLGSFSYTSRASFIFISGDSLSHHIWLLFLIWGFSLTHLLCGEFLLHTPYRLCFYVGSFSYTSRAVFIFMRGVSLTHPMLALFFFGEFLLHIPCLLLLFSSGEFLLHIPWWLRFCFVFYLGSFCYTSRAGFIFNWGVSLTHPVLASFLSGEFLLQIPLWLYFSVGSFSYTSHNGLFF